MRKAILIFILALLAIGSLSHTVRADYMPNEVIAKFRPDIGFRTRAFVGSSLGLKQLRLVFNSDFAVFEVPDTTTPEQTIARLQSNPFVLYAERNPLAHVTAVAADPEFSKQWSLQVRGNGVFGIDAPDAWTMSTGTGLWCSV